MTYSSDTMSSEIIQFTILIVLNVHGVLGLRNFTLNESTISLPELSSDTVVGGESRYHCFLNVRVFSDQSMNQPADNIPVYALTERNGNYIGYSMSKTDGKGNACVMTLCHENALLLVETENENASATSRETQHLHFMMQYDVLYKNRGIKVHEIMNYGSVFGAPGPVYAVAEREFCENSVSTDFHFKFYFFLETDKKETNPNAQEYDANTSWYPLFSHNDACFVKVQFQTNIFATIINAESMNANTNFWYGTSKSSAKGSSTVPNIKAACVEFRCPAIDDNNADVPTFLNASLSLPLGSSCNFTKLSTGLEQNGLFNVTNKGFGGILTSNSNYGPVFGIYRDKKEPQDLARSSCYTGRNAYESVNEMDPEVGFAVSYSCQ